MLSAYVCRNLLVMQTFTPGVISRRLHTPASHAGNVISWCLHKPANHAGNYPLCYQHMYAHTCQSCKHLYLVLSADDSTHLQVMQFVPLAWWQHGIQLSQQAVRVEAVTARKQIERSHQQLQVTYRTLVPRLYKRVPIQTNEASPNGCKFILFIHHLRSAS